MSYGTRYASGYSSQVRGCILPRTPEDDAGHTDVCKRANASHAGDPSHSKKAPSGKGRKPHDVVYPSHARAYISEHLHYCWPNRLGSPADLSTSQTEWMPPALDCLIDVSSKSQQAEARSPELHVWSQILNAHCRGVGVVVGGNQGSDVPLGAQRLPGGRQRVTPKRKRGCLTTAGTPGQLRPGGVGGRLRLRGCTVHHDQARGSRSRLPMSSAIRHGYVNAPRRRPEAEGARSSLDDLIPW